MQQLPPILPPPDLADGTTPTRSPERHANLVRFQSELEFVQCLSNPRYINELHAKKYFDDPAFLNYLKYLEYWRRPEYVRFIIYPTCLVYLTLLNSPTFRQMIGSPEFTQELVRIGQRHFETWRADKEPDTPKEAKVANSDTKPDKLDKPDVKPDVATETGVAK